MSDYQRSYWNFETTPELTFGPRSTPALARMVRERAADRVLVITDAPLRRSGVVDIVLEVLGTTSASVAVFEEGEPEPSSDVVEQAASFGRQHQPDLIVAVGGGSNMDLAKATSAVLAHQCPAEELFGVDRVPGPIFPVICLPTTAGTGSEMSHASVIKHSGTGKKLSILSYHIRPVAALVDPYLTISCPPRVTAESGMDALTHALEAFLVRGFFGIPEPDGRPPYEGNHPLGDLYAERAIRLIAENLPRVMEDPQDLAGRTAMSFAATLAGVAFSSCGVCLVHGLEYPVGAAYHTSHGVGNALLLPAVLRYWQPVRTDRLAQVAVLLGVEESRRSSQEEAAHAAIAEIESLRRRVGLPERLRDVGAKEEQLPRLAASAAKLTRLTELSPRPVTEDDLLAILRDAY